MTDTPPSATPLHKRKMPIRRRAVPGQQSPSHKQSRSVQAAHSHTPPPRAHHQHRRGTRSLLFSRSAVAPRPQRPIRHRPWHFVLPFLAVPDAAALGMTNRASLQDFLSQTLWRGFLLRDFGLVFIDRRRNNLPSPPALGDSDWRRVLFSQARVQLSPEARRGHDNSATGTSVRHTRPLHQPARRRQQPPRLPLCYSVHRLPSVNLSSRNVAVARMLGNCNYRRYAWCTVCQFDRTDGVPRPACIGRTDFTLQCHICRRHFCGCTTVRAQWQSGCHQCGDHSAGDGTDDMALWTDERRRVSAGAPVVGEFAGGADVWDSDEEGADNDDDDDDNDDDDELETIGTTRGFPIPNNASTSAATATATATGTAEPTQSVWFDPHDPTFERKFSLAVAAAGEHVGYVRTKCTFVTHSRTTPHAAHTSVTFVCTQYCMYFYVQSTRVHEQLLVM